MAQIDMGNTVQLKTWATSHDVDPKRSRRFARNGKLPGAFQTDVTGNLWLIPDDADVPAELSTPATRGRGTRTDGRLRYVVHATPTEIRDMSRGYPDVQFTDPRVVSKQRRDAKRVAATHTMSDGTFVVTDDANADARAVVIADTKPDGAL